MLQRRRRSSVDSGANASLFRHWLQMNSKAVKACFETFVDDQGIRRMLHNWEPVQEGAYVDEGCEEEKILRAYRRGGCAPLLLKETGKYVIFVNDYKRTWNVLALSPEDSFGHHALLFEISALFFFDKRTIHWMCWLTLYDICVYAVTCIVQPKMFEQLWVQMIISAAMLYLYLCCCSVYKASLNDSMLATNTLKSVCRKKRLLYAHKAVATSKLLYSNAGHYPLSALWKTYASSVYHEFESLCGCADREYVMETTDDPQEIQHIIAPDNTTTISPMTASSDDVESGLPSRQAVELSASRQNALHREIQSRQHLTTSSKPCECAYYLLLNVGAKFLESHTMYRFEISQGGRYMLLLCFVVIPLLFVYNYVLFMMSYDCIVPGGGNTAGFMHGLNCAAQYTFVILSFGTISFYVVFVIITLSILVALVGLLYGAIIMHALAMCWVDRYAGLRIVDDQLEILEEQERRKTHGTGPVAMGRRQPEEEKEDDTIMIDSKTSYSRSLLRYQIERDAYEHYLFIQEYVTQASDMWSPLLLVLFVVSLLFLAFSIYQMFSGAASKVLGPWIWIAAIFVFTTFFPIYCIAYANAAMRTIQTCFIQGATPSDFEILGGRDVWIEYLNQTPAYWTVFGIPVTWSYLYTVLGTVVGSLTVLILSQVAKWLSS